MSPWSFAWRSLTRQPARALLGTLGVTVVGALLFDMLMLSRGLEVSFEELLDGIGFDIRVTASEALPGLGRRIANAGATAAALRELPEIEDVVPMRIDRAEVPGPDDGAIELTFIGAGGRPRGNWSVIEGADLSAPGGGEALPPILINRRLADRLDLSPGDRMKLRGRCTRGSTAIPLTEFRVVGIAAFVFDAVAESTAGARLPDLFRACGEPDRDAVDFFLVASGSDVDRATEAILRARPDLHVRTNQQLVGNLQRTNFSYFRQVSFALSVITLFFAFLLISTLLTVSVNQRLGEIAGLRALGFPRRRVAADLIVESVFLVGAGGLLSLPVGGLVAGRLDAILRDMPGLPQNLHFFVFQPWALLLHVALLLAAGVLAALYPVYLAARLPIAATLRKETVS